MAEAAIVDATPADAPTTPQAGGQATSAQAALGQNTGSGPSTQNGNGQQADSDGEGDGANSSTETISLAEARKLRRENQSLRRQVDESEKAKMTDLEKAQSERDAAAKERDEFRQENRRLQAMQALTDAGARHPELLVAQIPDDALEDDASRKAWVADRKKQYPDLFRAAAPSVDAGAKGETPNSGGDMNSLIRRATGRSQ